MVATLVTPPERSTPTQSRPIHQPLDRPHKARTRNWWYKRRGLIGTLYLITFGTFAALSYPTIPEGSWTNLTIIAIAWATFFTGAMFRFWATLYIGGRKSRTVVCEGPYSICRNPLYVGSMLLLLSAGLFLKSLTFLAGTVIPVLAHILGTVPGEEAALRERFGADYVAYCRRTPRFWPRFSQWRSPGSIEVHLKGLHREFNRALGWLSIPIVTALLSHLRWMPWWPHVFKLP